MDALITAVPIAMAARNLPQRTKRRVLNALCITTILLLCTATKPSPAQAGEWTWMGGSNTVPQTAYGWPVVYGTLGVPAPDITPGSRQFPATWTDAKGNLWLYGGLVNDPTGQFGAGSDLWEFRPATNQWTWISGSSTMPANQAWGPCQPAAYGTLGVPAAGNTPGCRENAMTWIDGAGNLWLLGGIGLDANGNGGSLSDLWEYKTSTNQWAWMSGGYTIDQAGVYGTLGIPAAANLPGSRMAAASWVDSKGNFWLFGGEGIDSTGFITDLNDLWEFDPSTNEWVWMAGNSTGASTNQPNNGIYGTLGVSDAGNTPGGRLYASSWTDSYDNLWLFGGMGIDSTGNGNELNDLWKFSPSSGQWTWMGGSNFANQSGISGTLGLPASGNIPNSRHQASTWTDREGNTWLFGGTYLDDFGNYNYFNDLWEFVPSANEWTWMGGNPLMPTGFGTAGIYGTLGITTSDNFPGSRAGAASWMDSRGNFWLFGGRGYDNSGTPGVLDDVWTYGQPPVPVSAFLTSPAPGSKLAGTRVTFTWTAGIGVTKYRFRLGTTKPGSGNLYTSGVIKATSATVSNLPKNGKTIYARLYSHINGEWQYIDYTYTAK